MISHSRVLAPCLHDAEPVLTLSPPSSPSPSPSPPFSSSFLPTSSGSHRRRSFSIDGPQRIPCENGGIRCGRNGGKVAAGARIVAKGLCWRHVSSFARFGSSHSDLMAWQWPQRRRGRKCERAEKEEAEEEEGGGRYGATARGGGFGRTTRPARASASPSSASATATTATEFNSRQMLVFVPPHPLIKHWIAVLRNEATPPTIFRGALAELGRLLVYEATRDWMPLVDMQIQTPLGEADVSFVDPSQPIKLVPILRAGVVMLEEASSLLPASQTYHVGYNRDDQSLLPSLYLNRLPETFPEDSRVMVVDPLIATGGTLEATIEELRARGVDTRLMRVITAVCCPTGLQKLTKYEGLRIYAGIIDPELNSRGMIVPGIGDAGDRSFGT
ncbi:hypothetical protein CBR_g17719 [Chara braunii]|uniref:uracil phosphoribosyltransferase n=1 Tax=Chara braunii TaxID=69332 RepID=A0A388KVD1_CHABU|nr:hypothetical protein CBR_g17719 [Chara braunii]|eukprot:GBG74009.1 hypothetical protein CBR_g17719 [Chara braunii]